MISQKTISLDVKNSDDLVYLLGETFDELGGSEYLAIQKIQTNWVPQVNAEKNNKLYHAFYKAVKQNLIASSISLTRGGLAIAASKSAIGGMLGMTIDLTKIIGKTSRDDFALFSESQGRILVTIPKENKKAFEKIMVGNVFSAIGKVTKEQKIIIRGFKNQQLINLKLTDAINAYRKTLKNY